MKTKLFFLLFAGMAFLTTSLVMASCKKPKLVGTSWRLHYEMQALDDGPSIKETQILTFIDETTVKLAEVTERSGYSASYMNEDGTVDYTPGSTSDDTKKGTYVVNDNIVEITIDGKATKYYIHNKLLLQDTTPEEYEKMEKFERELVVFKRIK